MKEKRSVLGKNTVSEHPKTLIRCIKQGGKPGLSAHYIHHLTSPPESVPPSQTTSGVNLTMVPLFPRLRVSLLCFLSPRLTLTAEGWEKGVQAEHPANSVQCFREGSQRVLGSGGRRHGVHHPDRENAMFTYILEFFFPLSVKDKRNEDSFQ